MIAGAESPRCSSAFCRHISAPVRALSATTSPSASRHVERVVIEHQAAIARGLVRPPDLPGVERQHRHASLEAHRVDVVAGDADRRVDVRRGARARCGRAAASPVVSHGTEPSLLFTASTLPLSKPHSTTSPMITGRAVPRSDSRGTCCSCAHSSWPSSGLRRVQLAVDRAHRDQVRGDRGCGQHFAVQRARSSAACRQRVEGEQPPVARADQHQVARSPRYRPIAAHASCARHSCRPLPGRTPRRRPCGRRRTRDCSSIDIPSPRRSATAFLSSTLALHTRFTMQARLGERGELGGLIDGLVLGAGGRHQQRRQGTQQHRARRQVRMRWYCSRIAVTCHRCGGVAGGAGPAARSAIFRSSSCGRVAPRSRRARCDTR